MKRHRPEPDGSTLASVPARATRAVDHFLLTNFNVRLGWTRDAWGQPTLTPEWMAHRWRLFETFCLPSVQGQTASRFRWLVRFHPATPEAHRQRFRELTAGMTHVQPLWRAEPFSAAIGALLDPAAELLLTTRLDNDDAIHRTAMARIRGAVGDTSPEFLNFPQGFSLFLTGSQPTMVPYTHHSNPFLSLVERVVLTAGGRRVCRALPVGPLRVLVRANRWLDFWRPGSPRRAGLRGRARRLIGGLPVTVRCIDHRRVAEVAPVRQVSADPLWLTVIHGRNAGQSGRPGDACSTEGLDAAFNIRLPLDPEVGRELRQ